MNTHVEWLNERLPWQMVLTEDWPNAETARRRMAEAGLRTTGEVDFLTDADLLAKPGMTRASASRARSLIRVYKSVTARRKRLTPPQEQP